MILLKILLRIFIGFYKDFTNFYGFVKKMVQTNQYTYNVPSGSRAPVEDFIEDFTKDFNKDFTKGFTKDFTNDFVGRGFQ